MRKGRLLKMNEMKKITVLEIFPGDSGYICCNDVAMPYAVSDDIGDVTSTLKCLIEMGAIPSEMVDFYTAEEAVRKLNEMG